MALFNKISMEEHLRLLDEAREEGYRKGRIDGEEAAREDISIRTRQREVEIKEREQKIDTIIEKNREELKDVVKIISDSGDWKLAARNLDCKLRDANDKNSLLDKENRKLKFEKRDDREFIDKLKIENQTLRSRGNKMRKSIDNLTNKLDRQRIFRSL